MQILIQTQWWINFSTQQFREINLIFDIVCVHGCRWKRHNRNWPFKKDKSILIVMWKQIETKRILYFTFGMILLPHSLEINTAESDACVQAKGDGRWDVCLQACASAHLLESIFRQQNEFIYF